MCVFQWAVHQIWCRLSFTQQTSDKHSTKCNILHHFQQKERLDDGWRARKLLFFITIKNLAAVLSHQLNINYWNLLQCLSGKEINPRTKKVLLYTHSNTRKSKTTQGQIPSKCLKNKRTLYCCWSDEQKNGCETFTVLGNFHIEKVWTETDFKYFSQSMRSTKF